MKRISLLVWIGMVPLWAGEMPEKAAEYHQALAKRPESQALFVRFRDAWLEERSVEELDAELLSRAVAGDFGAWALLGRARLAAGKEDAAVEAFAKAREQGPAAWLDLEVAKLRLAAKDFPAAEKAALAVPENDPRRSEALKLAGLACLRGDRLEEALAFWAKAVEAAPGDKGLLEDLTELTRREGRFDLALEFCGKWRNATEDAYDKAMATLRQSELLLGSQRFDEAMAELAAVLKVSADDSWLEREAIARAEQAHRQQGNTIGWAKWIASQADENPTRLNFRRALANALASSGKTDEALEVLAEVLKRSPGDTAVRWQRVDFLMQSMKLVPAFEECKRLSEDEKSESAWLRLAELAFRLEKKDEVKSALDAVLAAADPAKRVGLAGLYARYGLPEESEKAWRGAVDGEGGGLALRELAKHLRALGRDREAIEVWKKLGTRDVSGDRIEAAQMLAAAGERESAREILMSGRQKFSAEPGYEAARAELALMEEKADEARTVYLALARAAERPDELAVASKGWLRAVAKSAEPLKDLGEITADRCLRATWLAELDKPLPAIQEGDELERTMRLTLLREHGKWPEVVAIMEAQPGGRGPLFLSELAEAKTAAGDHTGALKTARTWRETTPDQPGPWLREADILEKLGQPKEATVSLRRASARFEDNEDVARRLFSLLQISSDPREAVEWAWKRHDRSEDESSRSTWLREILRASKERGQLDDLKERFEERARRDPASPGPLVALAELAKARGDSRAELDFLRRAAVNAPRDVAIVSAVATMEERSGESARALERHASLARLVPGPDSARQLAQAKIRLGDIEGGVRDLQLLAGEKGIDLRSLEQSSVDLGTRGYVEEAIRMLMSVDPEVRDARMSYVLGILLETDGREREAVDAFVKVMEEPEDPAEKHLSISHDYRDGMQASQLLSIFQSQTNNDGRRPGILQDVELPDSLISAKASLRMRLMRLAIQHGGEFWTKASAVVPEMNKATPEQWREAVEFNNASKVGYGSNWWQFAETCPGNPLGFELLMQTGQLSGGKPEQIDVLLKHNPTLKIQLLLRSETSVWRPDTLEFLESIDDEAWQDLAIGKQVLVIVERMFAMACSEDPKTPVTIGECLRGLAVLGKPTFDGQEAQRLELLRIYMALLEMKTEEVIQRINNFEKTRPRNTIRGVPGQGIYRPMHFAKWRKQAGDKAMDALIARIESPVLRCQLSRYIEPKQWTAMIDRELAALPADAPAEIRRGLIRFKWSSVPLEDKNGDARRKMLEEFAANEADPRLALEANLQLGYDSELLARISQTRIATLLQRLMASPDVEDQAYASSFGRYSNRSQIQAPKAVTRWGGSARYSNNGYGRPQGNLPAILAMDDRDQATREAAKLLESVSRSTNGRADYLRDTVKQLTKAGLLEGAFARIPFPQNTGLARRVSMIALLDACGKPDQARSLIEDIAKSRPWETRWTVELALRTPDDAEMHRLLDSMAGRSDFDPLMATLLMRSDSGNADKTIGLLMRVADWAPQAKGTRLWICSVMAKLAPLAGGSQSGIKDSKPKNEPQLECYRRYVKLALDDRRLAEIAFRIMISANQLDTPEIITDAARRSLLAGAYTSDEPILIPPQVLSHMSQVSGSASLERLVFIAQEKGDEVAFPAEFLTTLKTVDPASESWIRKMLAAKTVTDLPDLTKFDAESRGWVALARHNAAMLRAAELPGRDAWITAMFRDRFYGLNHSNFGDVIQRSLQEAAKTKTMPKLVITWLEAAAGPRKSWGKREGNEQDHLPEAAAKILNSAAQADAATLHGVFEIFREAKVPVQYPQTPFNRLSQLWQAEMNPPRNATFAELLGPKRDAAYTLGTWQSGYSSGGKMTFNWALPQLLGYIRSNQQREKIKTIKDQPDASFLDLMLASTGTSDKTLQRRAIDKAAPDLAKLPEEIRHAVIDSLTRGMSEEDIKGLPGIAAVRLRERLAAETKQRLATVRRSFEELKSDPAGLANKAGDLGSLLGQAIGDDDAFVTEVMTTWRPFAEADKSGAQIAAFTGSLAANSIQRQKAMMPILRLLDSLWKGSPPPTNKNSNWGDPMQTIWNNMGRQSLANPEMWRGISKLSPKLQAQFWLHSVNDVESGFAADPKLVKTLRESAKGSEITRTAFEWRLLLSGMSRDRDTKFDGAVVLDFCEALKAAGSPAENISIPLCRAYQYLHRFENPAAVMAATPVMLEGLKSFANDEGRFLFRGIETLWERARREQNKANNDASGKAPQAAIHPVESAAVMKFVFTRNTIPSKQNYHYENMTPIVLGIDDPELLGLWVKFGGQSIIGNSDIIIRLLEQDRIAEAVTLTPLAGRGFSQSILYNAHIESLVAKLRKDPSPRAFALRVSISISSDARGDEAPTEKYETRQKQLLAEFEQMRGGLSVVERATYCQRLGLTRRAAYEHVPALDDFADEATASAFRKMFVSGTSESVVASIFIPAVCSKIHADDLSGLATLTTALPPATSVGEFYIDQFSLFSIQSSLFAHANRFDAILPEASAAAILGFAKALARYKNAALRGVASRLIHLAATDAASLKAGLEQSGLENTIPPVLDFYRGEMEGADMVQAMLRVAVLHPVSSEVLLATLATPRTYGSSAGAMLPLLCEPKLRAKIPPEIFLKWNGTLMEMRPELVEGLKLYAAERRGDFDENQRNRLDMILKRLEGPRNRPTQDEIEEMRFRHRQEIQQRQEEMMRQRMKR